MTQSNQAGKWLLYAGILTFIVYSEQLIAPAVTTKFFWLALVAGGLLLVMARQLWALHKRTHEFSYTVLDVVFGLLVLTLLVTSLLSPDPTASLVSDFERLDGWLLWFIGFVYFVGLTLYVKVSDWPSFLLTTALAGGLVGLFAFNQSAVDADVRVDSVVGNAMFLGQLMLLLLTFSVYGYITARKLVSQYVFLSTGLVAFVTLMLTGTRGAVLGLVAGAGTVALLTAWRFVRTASLSLSNLIRLIAGVVVGLVVLAGAVYVSGTYERFADMSLQIDTDSRYYLFEAGIQLFLERPLTGWGFEQYDDNYQRTFETRYFNKALINSVEPWHDRAHNTYIDIAIAGGVVGIGLLLLLALLVWRPVMSTSLTKPQVVLFGGLAGWIISSLFTFPSVSTLLAFVILLALWRKECAQFRTVKVTLVWQKIIALVLAVLGAGLLILTIMHSQDAAAARAGFTNPAASAERIEAFIVASEDMTFSSDGAFVRTLATDELRRAAGPVLPTALREQLLQQAEQLEGLATTHKERSNVIEAYLRLGRPGDAARVLSALELQTVTWQPTLLLGIEVWLANEEYEQANAVAHRIYELEPNNDRSVLAKAAALLREGDEVATAKLMNEYFGTYYVYDRVYLLALLERASDDVLVVLDEADKSFTPNMFRRALRLLATPVSERDDVLASYEETDPLVQTRYESLLNTPSTYQKGIYTILHW